MICTSVASLIIEQLCIQCSLKVCCQGDGSAILSILVLVHYCAVHSFHICQAQMLSLDSCQPEYVEQQDLGIAKW